MEFTWAGMGGSLVGEHGFRLLLVDRGERCRRFSGKGSRSSSARILESSRTSGETRRSCAAAGESSISPLSDLSGSEPDLTIVIEPLQWSRSCLAGSFTLIRSMNSSSPAAFLYDIGNVLVTFDFSPAQAAVRQRSARATPEAFDRIEQLKHDLESGRIDDETFLNEAVESVGFRDGIDEFRRIWSEIFSPNPPMWQVVEKLAGRYPLYLLSNTSGLHMEHLNASYEVLRHFDDGIYSHSAKCAKPGEDIFRQAIERFDLDPARTVYVDDLPDNVATGLRLGFDTIAYSPTRHEEFLRALGERDVALD